MTARRTGLGRGLEALIPTGPPTESGFALVPVDRVDPNPRQPRSVFDDEALEALAASIREVGVLQPVIVHHADDRYTLVAGERRWRAAQMAGLHEIPAIIRTGDDASSLTEALVENLQRENLSPLEEAAAYRQLMEDFAMTHEQIGARVAKSRATVTNTLRLLNLPAAVQGMLERGELTAGHARALLSLDDTAYAVHIAERTVDEGWSVRQVEDAVRARQERPAAQPQRSQPARGATPRPAAIIELEERLAEQLGAAVHIHYADDHGKMVISFGSLDELERIYRAFFA